MPRAAAPATLPALPTPERSIFHLAPRDGLILLGLFALALWLWLPGLGWGLPSDQTDQILFGDHARWTGEEVIRLADGPARTEAGRADQRRAEAVRRFRLRPPDPAEFHVFEAITNGGDPKIPIGRAVYVAPVKLALWATAICRGEAPVLSEAEYLNHPDRVRRVYLFARGYSAACGLAGIILLYLIASRFAGRTVAAAGGLLVASAPWILVQAHAAHSNLPAIAVGLLIAAIIATRLPPRRLKSWWPAMSLAVAWLLVLPFGLRYRAAYQIDATPDGARATATELIDHAVGSALACDAPAGPATLPPLDLWRWSINADSSPDVVVRPVATGADATQLPDGRIRLANDTRHVWFATPATFADRPFEVVVKGYYRKIPAEESATQPSSQPAAAPADAPEESP